MIYFFCGFCGVIVGMLTVMCIITYKDLKKMGKTVEKLADGTEADKLKNYRTPEGLFNSKIGGTRK